MAGNCTEKIQNLAFVVWICFVVRIIYGFFNSIQILDDTEFIQGPEICKFPDLYLYEKESEIFSA